MATTKDATLTANDKFLATTDDVLKDLASKTDATSKAAAALIIAQRVHLAEAITHLEAASSEKMFIQNKALHEQVSRLTQREIDLTKERDDLQHEVGLLHKALAPEAQAKASMALVAADASNGVDTVPPIDAAIAYYVEVMRNQCISVAMGDYKNLFTPTEFTKLPKDVLMMEQAARIGKSIARLPLPMPVTMVPAAPPLGSKI